MVDALDSKSSSARSEGSSPSLGTKKMFLSIENRIKTSFFVNLINYINLVFSFFNKTLLKTI